MEGPAENYQSENIILEKSTKEPIIEKDCFPISRFTLQDMKKNLRWKTALKNRPFFEAGSRLFHTVWKTTFIVS